jgi:hypothetical protein
MVRSRDIIGAQALKNDAVAKAFDNFYGAEGGRHRKALNNRKPLLDSLRRITSLTWCLPGSHPGVCKTIVAATQVQKAPRSTCYLTLYAAQVLCCSKEVPEHRSRQEILQALVEVVTYLSAEPRWCCKIQYSHRFVTPGRQDTTWNGPSLTMLAASHKGD